ncbi:hypothetical protein NPIL_424451 [Nephila pilipes]|uniref:Uncharacterized protein n=1 Tax=Nephila pilipes TaxID=299642 RepID=A0A8X6MX06_NEPPI|nr:hypothetical protein NPIL_424451 [Nephila pilipes]
MTTAPVSPEPNGNCPKHAPHRTTTLFWEVVILFTTKTCPSILSSFTTCLKERTPPRLFGNDQTLHLPILRTRHDLELSLGMLLSRSKSQTLPTSFVYGQTKIHLRAILLEQVSCMRLCYGTY